MFGISSIEAEFVVSYSRNEKKWMCCTWLRYCITQIIKRVEHCPNKGMYGNLMTFRFAHCYQHFFAKKPKFCSFMLLRSMKEAMQWEGLLQSFCWVFRVRVNQTINQDYNLVLFRQRTRKNKNKKGIFGDVFKSSLGNMYTGELRGQINCIVVNGNFTQLPESLRSK